MNSTPQRRADLPDDGAIAQLTSILALLRGGVVPGVGVAGAPSVLRPFQFASLDDLAARVRLLTERAIAVEGLQPSTIRTFDDAFGSFTRYLRASRQETTFLGGNLDLQKEVLTHWRGWLLQQQRSRVTIRTYWKSLASLFRRIEEQDRMVNPLRWLPSPRAGRLLPKALSRDAARTVLLFVRNYAWESTFARVRNIAIISTMLFGGLRRSEIVRLRCERVDLVAGTVKVRGKGTDGGKERTVYLPSQLRDALAAYQRARKDVRPIRSVPQYFTAVRVNAPLTGSALRHLFAIVSRETHLHVTPHVLRHTYATLLRQAGVADRVSMGLLGHEDLSTLQRYSHVFDGEYRQEAEKLRLDLDQD